MISRLHLRLTPRLTLVYVLFAAALLAFVGVLAYDSGRSGLEAATISALSATAVEKEAALDEWIHERQSDLAVLAASPRILEDVTALVHASPDSPEARAAHDHLVSELSPSSDPTQGFLAVFVIDPETGQVIAATDSNIEGTLKEDRPYFVSGRNGPYVQNPYYSLPLQKPVMTLSMPLRAGCWAAARCPGRLPGSQPVESDHNPAFRLAAKRRCFPGER